MKFIHLADLHIGKRVNGFSMIEDQRYILEQIVNIVKSERPEAVVIAGDIYDKPLPSAEAVQVFDDLISALAETGTEIMVISGNHDSAERLSFGSRIMEKRGVHFAGVYDGCTHKVAIDDEFGSVNFYMLPFIKPAYVRAAFPDDDRADGINSYTDAVGFAIEKMDADSSERNVLIAHQFVTGGERCESEEISVGGLDNVDASVFEPFDYVALGHLHGPQNIGSERIRYAGSPLKYSFSEAGHTKSVTIITMGVKDGEAKLELTCRGLMPLRDMKELRGSFSELTDKNYFQGININDYMRVILTDEDDIIGALQDLRTIYPNIMRLEYDNERSRASRILPDAGVSDSRSPLEIFGSLYESMNGRPMDDERTRIVSELIERVWGEEQ